MTNYLEQYFTPPEVTRALLSRLPLPEGAGIVEPCAGEGWISRELPESVAVITGDVDRTMPVLAPGCDFFSRRASQSYWQADIIITNPPWSDAARFVRRALEITPNVAMLLRLTFLEPCNATDDSRRVDLLKKLRAHIVMPRVSFIKGKRGTDSVPPAWFIWGFNWLSHEELPAFDFVTTDELARHAGQQSLFSLAGLAPKAEPDFTHTQMVLEVLK